MIAGAAACSRVGFDPQLPLDADGPASSLRFGRGGAGGGDANGDADGNGGGDASPGSAGDTDAGSGGGDIDGGGDTATGPTCSDGIQNGGETGIDCGLPCPACDGEPCSVGPDCVSGKCSVGGFCLVSCTTWGPFSTPTPISSVNDGQDNWGPEITIDGLTLLHCTNGSLRMAERLSSTAAFGPAGAVPGINGAWDCDPSITGDGLELIYVDYSGSPDAIVTATRGTAAASWGTPSPTPGIAAGLYGPWISPDGLRIFLTSAAGNEDIVMASRTSRTASFGATQPVFTGTPADYYPSLTEDELTIVFASMRAGGPGRSDIWMATRANRTVPFGAPFLAPGAVNSAEAEWDPAISPNGDTLYFSSERAQRANPDVYMATRLCLDP